MYKALSEVDSSMPISAPTIVSGFVFFLSFNIIGVFLLYEYFVSVALTDVSSLLVGLLYTVIFNINTMAVWRARGSSVWEELQRDYGYANPISHEMFRRVVLVLEGCSSLGGFIIACICMYSIVMDSHAAIPWPYLFFLVPGFGVISLGFAIWRPYNVSIRSVKKFIAQMEDNPTIDWDQLIQDLHVLNRRLVELWSFAEAGAPVIATTASGAAGVLCCATVVVQQGATTGLILAFMSACALTALPSFLISSVTQLCKSTNPSGASIPVVARRYPEICHHGKVKNYQSMKKADIEAHRVFVLLTHSESYCMGFILFGTLITRSLVVDMFIKVGLILPTAYGLLVRYLPERV